MDVEARLQAIDRETLTPLVRQALGSDTVKVTDWRYDRLLHGSNSAGVSRITGSADDHGETVAWSLILKVVSRQPELGEADFGTREANAYQSGLLANLPGSLAAPRCFAVVELEEEVWIWLEEVSDETEQPWPLARYGQVARHLGQFNGAYLAGHPLPAEPWLSRGLLRAWVTLPSSAIAHLRAREHPLVRRAFPGGSGDGALRLWEERDMLFAALDRLPQTFGHLDANPANLLGRRSVDGRDETVALDWTWVGVGAIGQEIVPLISSSVMRFMVDADQMPELDERVFAGYLDGLCDAGWQGDPRTVRFGYAAASALHYGLGAALRSLSSLVDESQHARMELWLGRPYEEIIDNAAALRRFQLGLADEARELLDVVR